MSDSAFRIRRAATGDAGALVALGARLFEQTFGAANTPEDMKKYLAGAFTVDRLSAELADDACAVWIASDAATGEQIGYAVLRLGPSADGVVAKRPAEIQRIYADRAWHGRGVGQSLMDACIDQARAWACDVIWLAVWEKNPRAIAFYERVGFVGTGRKTFVLGSDIQRDLVMVREL
jgi:diamine N-acetyltransferase